MTIKDLIMEILGVLIHGFLPIYNEWKSMLSLNSFHLEKACKCIDAQVLALTGWPGLSTLSSLLALLGLESPNIPIFSIISIQSDDQSTNS